MGIELGLSRIQLLLTKLNNPQLSSFKAIHIAGTNGKGSICSYLSQILKTSKISFGRFNSPHLLQVQDSIIINGQPITNQLYHKMKEKVETINEIHHIKATEFELLTAIAFEAFKFCKIQIAIIETGLGGRFDSTNVLSNKVVLISGISKIAKDHENLLGNTLKEISYQKAGIVKSGIPCVIDGSNNDEVLKVVEEECDFKKSELIKTNPNINSFEFAKNQIIESLTTKSSLKGDYQLSNMLVALNIIKFLRNHNYELFKSINLSTILKSLKTTNWPGRLQEISINLKNQKKIPILLDGAHNESAATELKNYLTKEFNQKKILLIVSMTNSKDINGLFVPLLESKQVEKICLTKFDYLQSIEGMPWIKSYDNEIIKDHLNDNFNAENILIENNVETLFEQLSGFNFEKYQIVVCGSLYLVGEVLRMHLRNGGNPEEIY